MSKKKLRVWLGVSLIFFVIVGVGFVTAAKAFGPSFRHGFCKQGMPDFVEQEIPEFMIWKLDKGMKKLGLSDDQQEQYETFRKNLQKTIETGMETRQSIRKKTMVEFEKQVPDLSLVTSDIQTHIEQMAPLVSENLALFNQFYHSLDATQRKKITDRIKEKLNQKQRACPNAGKEG